MRLFLVVVSFTVSLLGTPRFWAPLLISLGIIRILMVWLDGMLVKMHFETEHEHNDET